jgi:thiamine biosynthesis lipoprotein
MEPDQMSRGIVLRDISLTTAGDYREFIERDGQHLLHTLDPRTGVPVQNGIASVTIIAKTANAADAWDTACMVLGLEASAPLLKTYQLQASMVHRIGSQFKTSKLGGFAEKK